MGAICKFFGNSWAIYKFCRHRGEIYILGGNRGNMHTWLRGMDTPAFLYILLLVVDAMTAK